MLNGKVLIDGDIVAYRAAFSTQDLLPKDAEEKVDDLINYILGETLLFPNPSDYKIFLTGKDNFRFDIAKSFPYKGNRKNSEKPTHFYHVREYLVNKWGATVSSGEEADDLISKEATRLGSDTIIASVDKDMLQIPCKHFNFTTGEWKQVSEWEGLKFFYTQILTGDRSDNIIGLYRVGPVTASKMLEGCVTEKDLWDNVLKAYDNDKDRVIENARLLWLRREEEEIWQPPAE
jgi:DNA polymerase-1